jgi:geranylgeranyl pyrophosphate synthase
LSLSAPSSRPPAEPHPVSRPGVTASALAPGTPDGPGVANAPGAASAAAASVSGSAAAGFAGLIDGFRDRLDREIAAFLAAKRGIAASTSGTAPDPAAGSRRQATLADPGDLVDGVARLMAQGGKRLRPALVYYTYRACGGRSEAQAMPLALATELLHTYLLIHDDIMDHAEVRRGQPAAHARFRDLHRAAGLRGDAGDFGRSVAILLGDLAHTYAVELFTGVAVRPDAAPAAAPAGPPAPSAPPASPAPSALMPPASAPAPSASTLPASAPAGPTAPAPPGPHWLELNRCFSEMCEEVIGGQYLEFLLAHRGHPEPASSGPAGADPRSPGSAAAADLAAAGSSPAVTAAGPEPTAAQARRESELLRVLRLKSGRYTAERPIQLGALLAGAPAALRAELSRYGTAVGEAFQLQDDLLGLFGDPAATGKPVGDDLREGKFTLLIHHALVKGSPADRQLVAGALGDPNLTAAEVARVQEALERTGARRAVNAMIAERLAEARRALATLEPLLSPRGPGAAGPYPDVPYPAGQHPAGLHPHGPHQHAPDSPAAEGLRFLSGLLDFLWEREQ